jgi:addiction module RelE/StbE family toxin
VLKLARHKQFKKDLARIGRRGWDLWELFQVMTKLAGEEKLGPEYKTHPLSGEYEGLARNKATRWRVALCQMPQTDPLPLCG